MDGSGDQRFTYRGVDPDQFLDMNNEQLMELFVCRIRRKFSRGLKRKPMALIKKLRKKKKEAPANEKPDVVKTHLRNMVLRQLVVYVCMINGKFRSLSPR